MICRHCSIDWLSNKLCPWIIFICLMNVLFPDSPVPRSNTLIWLLRRLFSRFNILSIRRLVRFSSLNAFLHSHSGIFTGRKVIQPNADFLSYFLSQYFLVHDPQEKQQQQQQWWWWCWGGGYENILLLSQLTFVYQRTCNEMNISLNQTVIGFILQTYWLASRSKNGRKEREDI